MPNGQCEPKKYSYDQLNQLNAGLKDLISLGYGPGNAAYEAIYKMRGQILGRLGAQLPSKRELLPTLKLSGFSPGELEVFLDTEAGWIAQAYPQPGAMPVTRSITREEAINLLSPNPDPDLVHRLMIPDTYAGE